ncbi:hypothetical protein HERIO_1824 [Hepatospora eriocheir]|uniref:Uncharacterized protein n=1 Tax=Hepatospora eriocheir TaxID=1081669 RepID=A0A1X0Q970_9MICR|nr:hypothetical protein HERIO_1824 [Hepatospora eriocheir]
MILGSDILKLLGININYEEKEVTTKYGELKIEYENKDEVKMINEIMLEGKEIKDIKVKSPKFGLLKKECSKYLLCVYILEKGENVITIANIENNMKQIKNEEIVGKITNLKKGEIIYNENKNENIIDICVILI